MSRPSHLSPDNILRFLQVTRDSASANEIGAALHVGKNARNALFNLLVKLKKRGAIEELPGGRYRLAGRKRKEEAGGTTTASIGGGKAESRGMGLRGSGRGMADALFEPVARDEVKGRLVLHHDGYGFVVPDVAMPQLD